MIVLTPPQAASLARVIGEHPHAALRLDTLAQPGHHGPLLATFGDNALLVEEGGTVESDPEGTVVE